MALDQLADLLRRWQVTGGRLDRARIVGEGVALLRGLSAAERRELGRTLGDRGLVQGLDGAGAHLPGTADETVLDRSVQRLLDLDADEAHVVLAELDAASEQVPPPPPPAAEPEPLPQPEPLPEPEPLPRPSSGPVHAAEPRPSVEPAGPAVPVPATTNAGHPAEHAMERLRGLDEVATAVDGTRDAVDLLRAFPDGWQRRRAADRLLNAGGLDAADAEAVLSLFDRQSDRSRVAAGLVMRGLVEVAALHPLIPAGTARRLARRVSRQR